MLLNTARRDFPAWPLHWALLRRPRKGGINFYTWIRASYRASLSLCAAILTELSSIENLPQ